MNRGSAVGVAVSGADTVLAGVATFFSIFGVYDLGGLVLFTTPGGQGVNLTATAEQRAIRTQGMNFTLNFTLEVRGCGVGEAQLKKGANYICQTCAKSTYLLEVPPPKTV
jgi:hypothetical protein